MIPYGHQHIDKDDINAVIGVLKSDFLTQGPKVLEFEKKLAAFCHAKFAVAVSSGTAALHLAYLAADIGSGDEVITSPNTFAATSNMILAVGAKPVFCDIRPDTRNIDENKIEGLITGRTKAIVPVHFAGHPCEMDKIAALAKKHHLTVIEDACHALGAKYKGKNIGGISDMTIFSFHPVKSVTTGEGGAIITNNETLYKKLLNLRSHGITKDADGMNVMTALGYNYRLTDIQAALGISQLKKLNKFVSKRRTIASWYKKEFAGITDVILPAETASCRSSWHIYVIRVKPEKRGGLLKHLKDNGVGANFHYPAVYDHEYYKKAGYEQNLTFADQYQKTCITIPLFPDISRKNIRYIAKTIKTYLQK